MMKLVTLLLAVTTAVLLLAACGASKEPSPSQVIKSAPAGNGLTVSLATADGVLRHGNSEFTLMFADSSGKPVDVGAVGLTFHMPRMGTMNEMNNAASFTTTATPGIYHGKAQIEIAGEWQAKITYEGPKGNGQASFPVIAQ